MSNVEQTITDFENAIKEERQFDVRKLFQAIGSHLSNLTQTEKDSYGLRVLECTSKVFTPGGFLEAALCNMVGAMVENGANPDVFGPLYVKILKRTLASVLESVTNNDEIADEALENVGTFCAPSQAILGSSEVNRSIARNDPVLLVTINILRWKSGGAKMLHMLLNVFDGEELLVVHSESSRTFRIKIWGISDNFQLHILLAEKLMQLGIPGTRPPATIVSCMEGVGGQQVNQTWIGAWNLLNWTALQPNGTLPDAKDFSSSTHWVWGEGVPADIAPFNGTRTLFLGPPSYSRVIPCTRIFGPLKGKLEIFEEISMEDSKKLIEKIASCEPEMREKGIEFVRSANGK